MEEQAAAEVVEKILIALRGELRSHWPGAEVGHVDSRDRNEEIYIKARGKDHRLIVGHRAMFQLERQHDLDALMATLRKGRWIDFLRQHECALVAMEGDTYLLALCH